MKKNKIIFPEDPLRALARTRKWQIIYHRAKEIGSIKLFENDTDFTRIQILFLQYLEHIAGLYMELMDEKNLLTEEVINDEIRSNAYLTWKEHNKDKKNNNEKNENLDRIVFTGAKRK